MREKRRIYLVDVEIAAIFAGFCRCDRENQRRAILFYLQRGAI
jgi:hypothetical protein